MMKKISRRDFLKASGVAAAAAALTACGSASSTAASSAAASTASSAAASSTGEITHLVMTFFSWTGAPTDTQKVQDAMNEILRDKIGVEVELQIYDTGSYKQSLTLALSGGEQVDLMNCIFLGYASMAAQGYLLDLEQDDLLKTYGSGIIDAVGEDYIDACRINGTLYGLPNNRDMAVGRGCTAIGTEYLTAVGYTAAADATDIIQSTQDEVDDLLAKIHAKFPDLETYRPASTNNLAQYSSLDLLGGNVFGVLTNYGKELTVVDPFTSQDYTDYCNVMYKWNQAGYISKDAATDTTSVGTLMSYTTGGKPGIKNQESTGDGRDMTILQTKDTFLASSGVASFPWTIPITTVNAQKAMELYNEFYTNADLENLLIYGIEGTHYKVVDGQAQTIADASGNSAYYTLGWEAPNQFLGYTLVGDSKDLWDNIKKFNDESTKSAAVGFTFDATNVSTELAAVQAVYDEYQKSVEYGFVDPATALPEMDKKMMDAGLQTIIDEKQKQLDAWAKTK